VTCLERRHVWSHYQMIGTMSVEYSVSIVQTWEVGNWHCSPTISCHRIAVFAACPPHYDKCYVGWVTYQICNGRCLPLAKHVTPWDTAVFAACHPLNPCVRYNHTSRLGLMGTQWTSTHRHIIHWMLIITQLWMNLNWVHIWFQVGNQFCRK
jgi:hypothetical protein